MPNALLSIQILPKTTGEQDVIPLVDRAIAVIQAAGVKHQVSALETTMEGELDHLLRIVAQMQDEMIAAGCPSVISQIKILYAPSGVSMDRLTAKYR
ncbi:MAG TPA: thiamine-binding protein [Limnochordia bacterium]|nr:thiamine-binding protein [Limnochordia bacterium]